MVTKATLNVDEKELATIDEAARFYKESRNNFVTKATLQRAYAVVAETKRTTYERETKK